MGASDSPRTAHVALLGCITLWFASSALCTACAKMALNYLHQKAGSCALTITTLQFATSAVVSGAVCVALGRRAPSAMRELVLVSLMYTLGFLLLNQSLGRLVASFTETVRGLEPLTSFALAWLLSARGSQLKCASGTALVTVLGGAALSVWAQPAFDVQGLVLGLLANCAFSSRALLVMRLQDAMRLLTPKGSSGHEVDPFGLFAAQHAFGLLLLVPATATSDSSECLRELTQLGPASQAAGLSALGFLTYNFLSLYVLLLLDAVAHSVCNTCRRAVTIVAAALIFRTHISLPSAAGIALIIGGAVGYAVAKDTGRAAAAHGSLLGGDSDGDLDTSDRTARATGTDVGCTQALLAAEKAEHGSVLGVAVRVG